MHGLSRYFPAYALALVLAACGGNAFSNGSQSFNPAGAALAGHSNLPATRVCTGSRIGHAYCDVLIERGGAPDTTGLTAANLENAYNLPITEGTGRHIFLVDAYDNPDAVSDFNVYRSAMGLPASTLHKYNQQGQSGNYPTGNQSWGIEIDLDVQMASASCPKCTVDLVEANSDNFSDIEVAETEAVKLGATIVSNSFSGSGADQKYFDTKGVEYLGSAGDDGLGIADPAAFSTVVAVGGTVLTQGGGSRGWSEKVWTSSGGGCAKGAKPPWQHDNSCAGRLANDVSAVAYGVDEYDSFGYGGWIGVNGTSISAPLCAGIFGLAGNARDQIGGRTFWIPANQKHLYQITNPRYSEQGGFGTPDGDGAF